MHLTVIIFFQNAIKNYSNKALHYVNKSLEIDTKINNNSKIVEHLTFQADLTFEAIINSATKKINEVLKLVEDDTEHNLKTDLYQLRYKCYKSKGAFDISLLMHEKYTVYIGSVQLEKNEMSIIKDTIQKRL